MIGVPVKALLSPDDWVQFPRAFLRFLTPAESVLLGELFRLEDIERQGSRLDETGAFLCSVQILLERIHWTEDQQRRSLQSLQEKGFVFLSRKGAPPKRWVRINSASLIRQIDETKK